MKKLTKKEQLFVKEYLVDFNRAAAARRTGYSKKTAKEQGYQLFTKLHIKNAINEEIKKISDKIDITQEAVVVELMKIAYDETTSTKDRLKALELLGKYKGIYTEKVETRDKTVEENPLYQQLKEMTEKFKEEE